jgi:3-keto-disaccharide hydrolase
MKHTKTFAVAAVLAVALLISTAPAATQQQAPPPAAPQAGAPAPQGGAPGAGGGRRGGGGFTQPDARDFGEHDGWTSLFDGKTLNGWSGDENWKVEDGAIVIESTCEKPTGTVYLVWQGGEAADFELKMEMKGTGNINGGVQYRGWIQSPNAPRGGGAPVAGPGSGGNAPGARPGGAPAAGGAAPGAPAAGGGAPGGGGQGGGPGRGGQQGPCPSGAPRGTPPSREIEAKWNMAGAQYDFDAGNRYTGQFYEQATGRGIIAFKGQAVRTETGKNKRLIATLGEQADIDAIYKPNEWNELHIIATGKTMTHLLNGRVISILVDEDAPRFHGSGILGLEVEATGKLFTRNIWLKKLN